MNKKTLYFSIYLATSFACVSTTIVSTDQKKEEALPAQLHCIIGYQDVKLTNEWPRIGEISCYETPAQNRFFPLSAIKHLLPAVKGAVVFTIKTAELNKDMLQKNGNAYRYFEHAIPVHAVTITEGHK